MALRLLLVLDLFLSGGRGFLVMYGETGDGRINFGERDSHSEEWIGEAQDGISWIDQMIDGEKKRREKRRRRRIWGGGKEKDKKGRERGGRAGDLCLFGVQQKEENPKSWMSFRVQHKPKKVDCKYLMYHECTPSGGYQVTTYY
jgi:hypothetical protein